MSTPIETNTEELQEILQTVYNLPNAGGGSASYDLTVNLSGDFWTSDSTSYNPADNLTVTYDAEEARNTAIKLAAGESVSVIVRGDLVFDSGTPYENCVMHPTFLYGSGDSSSEYYGVALAVNLYNTTTGCCGLLQIHIGSDYDSFWYTSWK